MKSIVELGDFDTGLYSGCEFNHSDGNGWLTIHVDKIGNKTINFKTVRFFKFTALPNCTPEMINAYFMLVDLGATNELNQFISNDQSSTKPYKGLKHFRIFLDETGCYDIFAEHAE
jgi:hypothetical protein